MSDITLASAAPTALAIAAGIAGEYARLSRSAATERAYAGDWRRFLAWCEAGSVAPCPARPAVIGAYLAHLATEGLAVSSIGRALASICQAHGLSGHPSPRGAPEVREVWRGIQRAHGAAQVGKRPLVVAELARICKAMPGWAMRDRAILLVGFAGAFRRSELVALDMIDISLEARGYVIRVRRSKTDQAGVGRDVAIPFGSDPATCPVRALQRWIDAARIDAGPVFRSIDRHGRIGGRLSAASVAEVVKRWSSLIGIKASELAGHSLRSGLATSAAAAGKTERAIMAQTGHRSSVMVRRYIKRASLFDECGAQGIGL